MVFRVRLRPSRRALPAGDVLVGVEWAGLNYKDALVLAGQGNLVKAYPHVGGIDFAGRVVESRDGRYHPGQAVVLTGWRVGETRWGGFAQRARVDAGMLVPLPKRFSTRHDARHCRARRDASHQPHPGRGLPAIRR